MNKRCYDCQLSLLVVLSHLLEKFSIFDQCAGYSDTNDYLTIYFANVAVFNCLWKIEFLSIPISEYWNRTTTLIPFLQHFCYFIPSYFMERFALLIDGTSYIYPCSIPLLCSIILLNLI